MPVILEVVALVHLHDLLAIIPTGTILGTCATPAQLGRTYERHGCEQQSEWWSMRSVPGWFNMN